MDQKTYSVTDARNNFADIVNEVHYTSSRIALEKHGKTVAAVVTKADLELLQEIERLVDVEEAKKALRRFEEEGGASLDDLREELDL